MSRLGGIPLALNHAGSFLQQTGCNVSRYLEFYENQWVQLFGNDTDLSVSKSIQSTWNFSSKNVKQKNETAAKFLLLWAHLDSRNVSYELLSPSLDLSIATAVRSLVDTSFPEWYQFCIRDRLAFSRIIGILTDYSLIEATFESPTKSESQFHSMHLLLPEWCYHSLAKKQPEIAYLATVVLASAICSISEDERILNTHLRLCDSLHLHPHCDRSIYRIHDWWADTGEDGNRRISLSMLSLQYGYLHFSYADYEKAERMYLCAYRGLKKSKGSYEKSAIQAGICLSSVYRLLGKPKE
jgi:hypothetical protein